MHLNQCLLCAAGLYVTLAFDDLCFQGLASQNPIYHGHSLYHLFEASNAIDRNTTTCMRTDAIGPISPNKNTWWKVDLGGVYSIYDINILFKNYDSLEDRQKGRFAGFSIYVSKTGNIEGSNLCYKDGPQLPPLNFTTTCIEYGRYVIFYNERKDGVVYPDGYQLTNVYTELCEVIVKGCKKPGVYGTTCDIPCPFACKNNACHIQSGVCFECEPGVHGSYCNLSCTTNCKDNTCHNQNGICFLCKPGWIGIYCQTKCTNGWYGVNCSQQCSRHCISGTTCNHVTGLCDKGCDKGWTGSLCIKECDVGSFGYDCVHNCSGNCQNHSACNKQTGHCDKGCNPGYTDNFCSKKCTLGHFGVACRERCSEYCINNGPCDHVSGACSGGCQDGYFGARCFNSCATGYYGKNCSISCPPSCNGTCEHIDGSCKDCKDGQECHCSKALGMRNQNVSSSSSFNIALLVSLVINFVFISGVCLLCRGVYTKKVSISRDLLSCTKKSIYTDTNVTCKTGEYSTYQELDLSRDEIQYQNTTI